MSTELWGMSAGLSWGSFLTTWLYDISILSVGAPIWILFLENSQLHKHTYFIIKMNTNNCFSLLKTFIVGVI